MQDGSTYPWWKMSRFTWYKLFLSIEKCNRLSSVTSSAIYYSWWRSIYLTWTHLEWRRRKRFDKFAILSKILKGPCINCAGIRTQGFFSCSFTWHCFLNLATPILNFPPFLCLFFSKDATNRFFRQKMSFVKKISVWFRSIENFFHSWIRFWRKIGDNSFWWKAELAKDWIPLTFLNLGSVLK